ncbi:single-stranded DNA-binding protein [Candidatus Peribacteria bacterium]|nr:single-stranded DNA-binding protein [Candidatus Peribacteria bacterium]
MFSLNRVSLIGYQTQPVELRQTPSGTAVTDLNIVVPTSFTTGSGEQLSGKGFFTVTLWGPMADVASQYVRPGAQLYISGRLQTDSWDDQTSGEKRSKTKVVAQEMILLDPKDGQRSAPAGAELGKCLNRAEVIGNVTKDPEMRTTTGGQNVLTIGVASNERWKDRQSGEMKERTEFHNVVLWGALAEDVAKHIKKGSKVYVAGRVQTRSWETQSGGKRTTTEIVADQMSMLGIANTVAAETVSTRAAMPSRERSAEESPVAVTEPVAAIPEVQYQSDVKVEDLPF